MHCRLQSGWQADFEDHGHRLRVKPDLAQVQLEHIGRAAQGDGNQHRADALGKGGRDGRARYAHMEKDNQHNVQHNIDKAADNQKIQRSAAGADRTQNARAHIIDKDKDKPRKIDAQVGRRHIDDILRRVEQLQQGPGQQDGQNRDDDATDNRKGVGGAQSPLHALLVLCPVVLRDNNCCAGGQAGEKADDQVDDLAG